MMRSTPQIHRQVAATILRLTAVLATIYAPAGAIAQTAPATSEIPAGGLVFTHRDKLIVDQETLTIGVDQIDIQYLVRSTDAKPRSIAFAFPMPTIDMTALYGSEVAIPAFDPTNPTNFVGFWTTLNGTPVEPEVDIRALAIGHIDVTAELNRLGLPLYPFAPDMAERLAALTADQKSALVDTNVISIEEQSLEPAWALRSVFHWRHVLASDASLDIRHNYKPIIGSARWNADIAATAKDKYCMQPEDIAELDKRAMAGKVPTVYWVHYVPSANAWLKGPSSLFKLIIEKPEATSIATTCTSDLVRAGPLRLEKSDSSRSDDIEIEVLFVE